MLDFRTTPHSTMNVSPTELFLGRFLHTRFNLLRPQVKSTILKKQASQMSQHDKDSKPRLFVPGQLVLFQNFHHLQDKWIPGTIKDTLGQVTFAVQGEDGSIYKHHVNHLHKQEQINNHSQHDIGSPWHPESTPQDQMKSHQLEQSTAS